MRFLKINSGLIFFLIVSDYFLKMNSTLPASVEQFDFSVNNFLGQARLLLKLYLQYDLNPAKGSQDFFIMEL